MKASPRALSLVTSLVLAATAAAAPQYQIIDLGVVQMSDTHSYGFGVSPAGIAVGRSGNLDAGQAFTWTQGGGIMGLPILSGRNSCVANSANDSGIVVGRAFNREFRRDRFAGDLAERGGFAVALAAGLRHWRGVRRERFGRGGWLGG